MDARSGALTAFYHRRGDGYLATALTRGPWDDRLQHAGPPAALLGREIARTGDAQDYRVARVTFEMRRPVPIGAHTVAVTHEPGRRVDRVQAVLRDGDGRDLIRAVALRVRRADTTDAADQVPASPPATQTATGMAPPGAPSPPSREFFASRVGYHTAMDIAFVSGGWGRRGPAQAWLRPTVNLVDDEPCSPLGRVLVAADSGNGLSAALDIRTWRFVNADLTVALDREPESDWVGLDARTTVGRQGRGLAVAHLHDLTGPLGVGLQTLLIERADAQP